MKLEGLPVYDAQTPLAFTVTKKDATYGGVKAPDSCAMALACKREHHAKDVRIHIKFSYVLEKAYWLRYRTPDSVAREIVAFDRGGAFDPGDYMLLPPFKSNRLGKIKRLSKRHISKRRQPNTRYMHITANVRTRPVFSSRVLDDRST